MSVKKFKFISPGIFINEIDNSHLPATPEDIGPVIIGRTYKGPAMRPVKVSSFSEFVEIFGEPSAGGIGGDVWRGGNKTSPTYAAYAAQAWLRNNSPLTVVRLLGDDHVDADTTQTRALAGWKTSATLNDVHTSAGGAYGLFIIPKDHDVQGASVAGLVSGSSAGFSVRSHRALLGDGSGSYATDTPKMEFRVPANAGGYGVADGYTIQTVTVYVTGGAQFEDGPTPTEFEVWVSGSDNNELADAIVKAVNGGGSSTTGGTSHSIRYGSSVGTYGVQGLSASAASSSATEDGVEGPTGVGHLAPKDLHFHATKTGTPGNSINIRVSGHSSSVLLNDPKIVTSVATTAAGTYLPALAAVSQHLTGATNAQVTGALAAVFYVQDGGVVLSGTTRDGRSHMGSGMLIKSTGDKQFMAAVMSNDSTSAIKKVTEFNLNENSDSYIRKVFNTDPTMTNSDINDSSVVETYWVGETYEEYVSNNLYVAGNKFTSSAAGDTYGIILGLQGSTGDWSNFQFNSQTAKTGWFISQDLRNYLEFILVQPVNLRKEK